MARMVRHDQLGPYEIKPQEKSAWVCGCGLSQKLPLCDGSHKLCRTHEAEPGKLYIYDKDRKKIVRVEDDV